MKQQLIKLFSFLINKLKDKQNDNYKSISSLAPKILTQKEELERIEPYTKRLKDAIDEKGITNIALTGAYGSGKSTIINTFQHLYPCYNYINISLASFKDNKLDDDLDRQLEVSILQQIFYHVKPSRIPDSRFKRIINLTPLKLFLLSSGLIIWVLSVFILFRFGYIENLNPNTWNLSQSFCWTTFFCSIVFFSGIGWFSRILLRIFINSKINKVNIKGEVELGNDIDKSVFNEHLEEIIYFFQRTEFNVVIIEDLDRFNNTDIFTKLREINILLNKSELIDREINFIYAVRDEMFVDKTERVKFFEYIIPVIPFINPSNAGEQLARLKTESNLGEILSKDFTEDIVTFIDDIDMRLLTNIFHEYVLYKDSLQVLNQDHLFAMITYKNIFPDDFGKLHKREGALYKLLSKKELYTSPIITENKEKIKNKEREIKNIEKESVNNIAELRAIYIHAILKEVPKALAFHIDDTELSFTDILEDRHFYSLTQSSNIEFYIHRASQRNQYMHSPYLLEVTSNLGRSFADIEYEVNHNFTYQEREQAIKDRDENKINKLKGEIAVIQNEISTIESWSLTQILEETDIDNLLKDTILDTPFMRNLLINGYINENYNDYISIFHGVNMTSQEFSFVANVKSGVKQDFNYSLNNIDQIIKKLPVRYFRNEAILNFDLFDYLAQHYEINRSLYTSIIELIKKRRDNSLKFMDEYISSERKYVPFFIEKYTKSCKEFWSIVYINSIYTDEKKLRYLYLILSYADLDSIYNLNYNFELTNYINANGNSISLFVDDSHLDKIKSVISKLSILIERLELPNDGNNKIFQYIYDYNYYEINIYNIILLLQKLTSFNEIDINRANYTVILKSDCKPLQNYVKNNLNIYITNVFLKLPENNKESENTLKLLLNNYSLKDDTKVSIIRKQDVKIKNISEIQVFTIWAVLFENNGVVAKWANIINYYNASDEKIIDESLITFMNIEENHQMLNREDLNGKGEEIEDFIEKLIKSNSLSFKAYKALVIKTLYNWNRIDFSLLDQDKVEWLVENKLNLTKNNFDMLKEYFPTISIKLIEKKRYELIAKYENLKLNAQDYIQILQSNIINQSIKIQIVEKIDNQLIIDNDTLKILVKNALYNSGENILAFPTLESIISYSSNNLKRLDLINSHSVGLQNNEIKSLVEKLGDKYGEMFESQKKPKFDYTQQDELLIKLLRDRKMINSYKIEDDKIRVVALYK